MEPVLRIVRSYRVIVGLVIVAVAVWILRSSLTGLAKDFAARLGHSVRGFIGLPVFAGFSPFAYIRNPYEWPQVETYFGVHVRLVVEAIIISLALAIPLGILLHRAKWLYFPAFILLDGIYTLPSLALFSLLLPFTGLGDATVLIPLVGYAQFILVRNVVAGLQGVPSDVKEAARGMGMTGWQILLRVELPLSLPIIVAGVRIATVASIGIAAIAALIAIPDLGRLFVDATTNGGPKAYSLIYAGAIAVSILAVTADMLIRVVERLLPAARVARAERESIFTRIVPFRRTASG